MNEEMELLLRSNQLIIRERFFNLGNHEEQAKVIDLQITDILNPKIKPTVRERTFDALKGDSA